VFIVYSPESQTYMPRIIQAFNTASAAGRNPVTGQNWASGQRPIYMRGQDPTTGSSGTVAQGVINSFIAPNNENVYHPTIFQPSVSHWLELINFQTGRQVFNVAESRATALSPVVIGMWESRLEAIKRTLNKDTISWQDLLAVLESPNGWEDFGIAGGRRAVYYGHADPNHSSTALSTALAEFSACAQRAGVLDSRRLTLDAVNNAEVQACVREIETLVRHYSDRTEDFLEYIARGPDYLDMLAMEETDVICLNRGAQQGDETCNKPSERLIAIYPEEGTLWHEHPFGIVNADWVTPEQQEAARIFTDFVLTPEMQRIILSEGFRPANADVPLDFPFVPENGIDPAQPTTVLSVPSADVLVAIQSSWALVKKQADVMLLMDVSGSMSNDGKMEQAIEAALRFVDGLEPTTRVGLTVFSDEYRTLIPLGNLETVRETLTANIRSVRADGGTELFQSVARAVTEMTEVDAGDRIRAVVLLSDGADTGDQGYTLNDAVRAIQLSRDSVSPVILIPVAYGGDADVNALNNLARTSATRVQSGDPSTINRLLEIISSYF
jgi:Ca-activated chloride channel family protein